LDLEHPLEAAANIAHAAKGGVHVLSLSVRRDHLLATASWLTVGVVRSQTASDEPPPPGRCSILEESGNERPICLFTHSCEYPSSSIQLGDCLSAKFDVWIDAGRLITSSFAAAQPRKIKKAAAPIPAHLTSDQKSAGYM